jgi:hypothetical protein
MMAIPYKQAIQEITDMINEELAKMPDDETRMAALNGLSNHMFNFAFKGDEGGVPLFSEAKVRGEK